MPRYESPYNSSLMPKNLEFVKYEKKGHVAYVTINRPEVMNALTGVRGAVVRVNDKGELIVSVAVPVQRFRAVLGVLLLSTQAGELPLIPEWTLSYTGTPGSGSSVLPAYIVTEDLIEYHWLSDPNPRVFQLGVPGSLASQYVVVKFGGLVVKGASYAHTQVLVNR